MLGVDDNIDWFHTKNVSNFEVSESSENSSIKLCMYYFDFTDPTINSLVNFPEEISELKVYYDDDLNLRQIHSLIREKFIRIHKKLYTCDTEISSYEWKLNYTKLSDLDKSIIRDEINSLKEFKQKYTIVNFWEIYKENVLPILCKYTPLMSKEVAGISNQETLSVFDDELFKLRQKYIKEYIDEVNKMNFVKISAFCVAKTQPLCLSCMKPLQQDFSPEVGGSAKCSCGYNESTIKHMSEYNDISRSISSNNDTDINVKQIKEWIDNVKCVVANVYGKDDKNNEEKEALFQKFDYFCQTKNLPHRHFVLNNNIPQPPMSTIISLLKLSKKPDLYNNKHQIRHDYYNTSIYNITESQEAIVIKMYVDFQNKYEETKKRKTKVHIEILGCVLLMMAGVKVNPADFKIPSASETIAYSHNSVFETMMSLGYKREQIPDILSIFT